MVKIANTQFISDINNVKEPQKQIMIMRIAATVVIRPPMRVFNNDILLSAQVPKAS